MEHTAYEKQLVGLRFELLADIVERQEPRIVPMLRGELRDFDLPPSLLGRALQGSVSEHVATHAEATVIIAH